VRLKRRLKRRTLAASIAALIHALRHLDACAASIVNRVKRNLTRRALALFALPPAADACVVTLAAAETCFADSS
jgi:hypothetical protein